MKAYDLTMKGFHSTMPRKQALSCVSTLFALSCLALGLMPGVVRANEDGKASQTSAVTEKGMKSDQDGTLKVKSVAPKKAEKILVTGSLIPIKSSRLSGSLDTASPVYIIDNEHIRRSGAVGVAGVLNRYGMRR